MIAVDWPREQRERDALIKNGQKLKKLCGWINEELRWCTKIMSQFAP